MEGKSQNFDIESSPLKEVYKLLGATDPIDLYRLYSIEDQKLFKAQKWDYNNPELIINVIKDIFEKVDINLLSDIEKEWRQELLWFWYHHATSIAIYIYKDKKLAKFYVKKALEYKSDDNPNKITQLMDFLINDQLKEAESLCKIISDDVERITAEETINEYKKIGGLFN